MKRFRGEWLIILCLMLAPAIAAAGPRTFCNPLNLDYGIQVKNDRAWRHGADPVIVLFNDRYYLFSTWDKPGYRVSDDLIDWTYIPFRSDVGLAERNGARGYTAAAVVVMDGWMYFTELATARHPVCVYRTRDPDSGTWEKVSGTLPIYSDPCLFLDPPSGRLFMYYGLDKPIRGVELDKTTFAELPGSNTLLRPPIDPKAKVPDGWEVCTWDNNEASPPMRGNKTFLPCREGSWMTYHDGTYYLQYASPGTTVPGYADGLLTGRSPLGPFEYSPYSPISWKDSGFITSAGHSCLFQDRHGNWWRAVTMLIGVHDRFERRIGLFPAGFDQDGVPFTRTELGDLPLVMPGGRVSHQYDAGVRAGWFVLSDGKPVTASSTLDDDHAPSRAADEDIRTWWSAKTGDAGEWMQIDLGEAMPLSAVQINLAEQDVSTALPAPADDAQRFTLSASPDGKAWQTLVDRAGSTIATPHTYAAFDAPVTARYLKLVNVSTPAGGKFAVSDLRAFGRADIPAPAAVGEVTARRNAGDRRKVTLNWTPAPGADAYLIRYGITEGKLYQHHLVRGGQATKLTIYSLNHEPPYFFRVDAVNDGGVTAGAGLAAAK